MSTRTAGHPVPARQNDAVRARGCLPRQMELFGGACGTATGTPTWLDLPGETRRTLTELMARLLLDHADRNQARPATEAGHDR
jgi:hypothetical protein